MKYIVFHLSLILALSISPLALATENKVYCPALDKSETYKSKKSYRYLVASDDGWLFRSRKDLKEDFTLTPETVQKFVTLSNVLKKQGKTLHIVMPPTRGIAHSDKVPAGSKWIDKFDAKKAESTFNQSIKALKAAGVSVAEFDDIPKKVAQGFYYKRDHHWSPIGAEFSAKQTAALIKPFQDSLPKKEFKTEEKKTPIEINQSFGLFVGEVCGIDIPVETVPTIQTYAAEEALFDDEAAPHIALIGSSNTTEPRPSYANFAGYMREFLQTEVDNLSVQGAGIDSPMYSYFAGDAKSRTSHKHLIWELASHYDFNGSEFEPIFKQLIPAAAGSCKGGGVIESAHELSGAPLSLLPADKGAVKAENKYMHFKFNKPVKREFAVSLDFTEGKSERFRFKRSSRYPHDGVFFLGLNEHGNKTIKEINLLLPKELEGAKLDFELCAYK